jgi:hypothetical protein
MASKALRRRKAPANSVSTLRSESTAAGDAGAERSAGFTPLAATKGRLRKCGPIVLISLRICF